MKDCQDGPISISDSDKVVRELGRVLKNNGKIWACVLGRYPLALSKVEMDSEEALKLCKRELNYIPYKGLERSRVFSPVELQNLFQQNGIEVIKQYGNRIVTPLLSPETQAMTKYDEKFFSEIKSMELYLSEEPAILGYAEYLQIVGIK